MPLWNYTVPAAAKKAPSFGHPITAVIAATETTSPFANSTSIFILSAIADFLYTGANEGHLPRTVRAEGGYIDALIPCICTTKEDAERLVTLAADYNITPNVDAAPRLA
ncbi:hypothetical protein EsH8_XIV_000010 [Colletotrichum jinshuiense]